MAMALIARMVVILLVVLLAVITTIMGNRNSHGAKGSISRDIASLDCDGVNPPIPTPVSFRADLQCMVPANSPEGSLLTFSTAPFIAAYGQNFPRGR
jgi:hypothetical protein